MEEGKGIHGAWGECADTFGRIEMRRLESGDLLSLVAHDLFLLFWRTGGMLLHAGDAGDQSIWRGKIPIIRGEP